MNQVNIKEVVAQIQQINSKRGRPKGSKNKPKFQYKTKKEYIFLFQSSSGIIPMTLKDMVDISTQAKAISEFRGLND